MGQPNIVLETTIMSGRRSLHFTLILKVLRYATFRSKDNVLLYEEVSLFDNFQVIKVKCQKRKMVRTYYSKEDELLYKSIEHVDYFAHFDFPKISKALKWSV